MNKNRSLLQQMSVLGLQIALVLFCVLCVGCENGKLSDEKPTIVLTAMKGDKSGEFGGYSQKELEEKDDPLAYVDTAYPQDFAVDGMGNLIVADTANQRLQKYSQDGHFLFSIYTCGTRKLEWPNRITADVNGNIIVANTYGQVCIYTVDGKYSSEFDTNKTISSTIDKVFVDSKSNILIFAPSAVYVYSKTGKLLETHSDRSDLAIDKADNAWDISVGQNSMGKFKYKPKGDWEYIRFIGIDQSNLIYSVVTKDKTDLILITDMKGNNITQLKSQFNDYLIYRWKNTPKGDLYGLGTNTENKFIIIRYKITP